MKILCVDTSSDICSVCIMEGQSVIEIEELKNGKTHSENLLPLIKKVLDKSELSLDSIDKIICCIGPGSFTGIRIGISAIKAIAEVHNLPVIGVTSLESLAFNQEYNGYICSIIDARNNQVYCGMFEDNRLLEDYIADDIEVILNKFSKYSNKKILFIGNGAIIHKERILKKFGEQADFTDKNEQTSTSIGKCAFIKYKESNLQNADTILPLYLRKSQAERIKSLKDN